MKRQFFPIVLAAATLLAFVGAGPLFPQEAEMQGVLVASVEAGSPAEKAGITAGDRILAVDGQAVTMPVDVVRAVRSHQVGSAVELRLRSGEDERTLTVVPEDRDGRPFIGVALRPALAGLGRDERPRFRPESLWGAMVLQVAEGSPADEAGLKAHDMILSVDGEKVEGPQALGDLIGRHRAGDTVTLAVRSAHQEQREVTVRLEAHPENADSAYLGVQYVAMPSRMYRGNPSESYGPRTPSRGSDAL